MFSADIHLTFPFWNVGQFLVFHASSSKTITSNRCFTMIGFPSILHFFKEFVVYSLVSLYTSLRIQFILSRIQDIFHWIILNKLRISYLNLGYLPLNWRHFSLNSDYFPPQFQRFSPDLRIISNIWQARNTGDSSKTTACSWPEYLRELNLSLHRWAGSVWALEKKKCWGCKG